jgi:hypothetical protein
MDSRWRTAVAGGVFALVVCLGSPARAAITVNFNLATDQNGGGAVPASAAANIVSSVNQAVAVFNRWSNYNFSVQVLYNSGVPTADANFQGTIRFGAGTSYHTPSIAWHEMLHIMGSGTYGAYAGLQGGGTWNGRSGIAMARQYYPTSVLRADGHVHWVDGQDPDLKRQGVHIMGAMRADMGISNGNRYEVPGDFNDNKTVGLEDYLTLRDYLHTSVVGLTDVDAYTRGDMNFDGKVDFTDLGAFRTAYLATGAGSFEALVASVPEPGGVGMLVVGFGTCAMGLGARRRK